MPNAKVYRNTLPEPAGVEAVEEEPEPVEVEAVEEEVAPVAHRYEDRSKKELQERARELEIKSRSAMTKDELIEALRDA